jgi:cytochrome c oxidase subunit III
MKVTVAHQFEDYAQQQESATLGMWIFLATEILFFGGMFLGYTVYRTMYHQVFGEASSRLSVVLGTTNTAVLLCSSLTMAMGVRATQLGNRKIAAWFLLATMALGACFLGIKFYEYYQKYEEHLIPGASFLWEGQDAKHAPLFFLFYFIMTGMHALHMIIGIVMLAILLLMTLRRKFNSVYYAPVELGGLYWHFVDIVWVFLFPLLYLVERFS